MAFMSIVTLDSVVNWDKKIQKTITLMCSPQN